MPEKQVPEKWDAVIIGAGASGLVCAAEAGRRNKKVLVLDHNKGSGRKILMSGGGRCNFTNREVTAEQFISQNPHFCKSAIKRFTAWDFLDRIRSAGIRYEEREHGQLFCRGKASEILNMLMTYCEKAGVTFAMNTEIKQVNRLETEGTDGNSRSGFRIKAGRRTLDTPSLVIATGGVSIPGAGASPLGYRIAEQFGIAVVPPSPGLVPFTLQPGDKEMLQPLSGIAVKARVSLSGTGFTENILFTHRGLSGPVILQISSYWQPGQTVTIDLLPDLDLAGALADARTSKSKKQIKSFLSDHLPKRLVMARLPRKTAALPVNRISRDQVSQVCNAFHHWEIKPGGTEGYRTAEVTVGGVDTARISSKTFEARDVAGLYFIGEVLDVTGWLGGFNLQWAWSSGWCAGQYV